jgi:hypothetical protein
MEVDLRLKRGPLASAPYEKYNLSFHGFDVQERVFGWGIFVTPDVEVCLTEPMTKGVTVVSAGARGIPSNPEAVSNRLSRDANVDWAPFNAGDVQLRQFAGRSARELGSALRT